MLTGPVTLGGKLSRCNPVCSCLPVGRAGREGVARFFCPCYSAFTFFSLPVLVMISIRPFNKKTVKIIRKTKIGCLMPLTIGRKMIKNIELTVNTKPPKRAFHQEIKTPKHITK